MMVVPPNRTLDMATYLEVNIEDFESKSYG